MHSSSPNKTTPDRISFVLDGEVIEISNVDPTRTVLQYLREDLRRTGTKEGCAEGDCGACTVVVAELDDSGDSVRVRAINSCIQFLATLDGKELITVESLRGKDGVLHPVQKAMVDCHGSQCGFCTPGFVMSLLALYKNNAAPTRVDIDDALAGNLCRCTGYRPIVDAAVTMYEEGSHRDVTGDWLLAAKGVSVEKLLQQKISKLQSIRRGNSLAINRAGRRFDSPRSIPELAGLVEKSPDATLLAGGTDVGLWVTKQHRELDSVIYLGNVAELRKIAVSNTHVEIGAAATLSDVMPVLVKYFPTLKELFVRFASPPIRNAGTLGGNVANGSPIGDSMPALLALDTILVLRKGEQQRELPIREFYIDYQVNALEPGEFLQKICVPRLESGASLQSYKVSKRFDQDISAVCAAFRIKLDDGVIADIRVAYGGLATTPKRAMQCEKALLGKVFERTTIDAAMQVLDKDFQPIADMRASGQYRMQVCRNLLLRFYLGTTDKQTTRVYEYGRV